MRKYRIGTVFGIPIQLDLTFLFILPVFAVVIAFQIDVWVDGFVRFAGAEMDGALLSTGLVPWVLGVLGAIGLFASVLLHELGHSLVAMRYDFEIESITLWLFGGVAKLVEMPEDWLEEFYIAIAGPIVSVVLGVLAGIAFFAIPTGSGFLSDSVLFLLGYLAVMNVGLAVFNMIPGFPMDGGRVLRAFLARSRPYPVATQQAAGVSKVVAVGLALVAVLIFNPILLALAGFLYIAATGEAKEVAVRAALEDVSVQDVMTPAADVGVVDERVSVAALIDRMFEERATWYPVVRGDDVVGVVELEDARSVSRKHRTGVAVGDIMTRNPPSVGCSGDMSQLLEADGTDDRVLVLRNGQFVGVLREHDIIAARKMATTTGRDERPDRPGADTAWGQRE